MKPQKKVKGISIRGRKYHGQATPLHGKPIRIGLEKWAKIAKLPSAGIPITDMTLAASVFGDFKAAVENERYHDIVAGRAKGKHDSMTMPEFLDVYEKRHIKLNRLESVLEELGPVKKYFEKRLLKDIGMLDAMIEYKEDLMERDLMGATINRRMDRMRQLLRWAVRFNYLKEQTAFPLGLRAAEMPIQREEEDNKRTRRIFPDEEAKLRGAIDDAIMEGRFLFALYTGARRGEMQLVTREQIDYVKWEVTFTGNTTKSGKTRVVAIYHDELRRFLQTRRFLQSTAYVFGTLAGAHVADFKRQWHAIVLRSRGHLVGRGETNGISKESMALYREAKLHWHDLRHEYGTRLAEAKTPLDVIQGLMGHADIKTTMRYLMVTNERMHDAVKFAHGGGK